VPFEKLGAVSYSPSIVTMAVSVAVCEIFSVKEWCDLENRVRVRSRLMEIAPFDRSYTSSYSPPIVTMAISCVARYSDLLVENRKIFIPHMYLAVRFTWCHIALVQVLPGRQILSCLVCWRRLKHRARHLLGSPGFSPRPAYCLSCTLRTWLTRL